MTEHHVQHIKDYLKSQGFTDFELMDDLTDHLATEIEFSMDSEKLDFETSLENAKQKLLPDSPYQLERDLKILTTPKHNIMMKKIAFIGGYLSALCLTISILFGVLSHQEKTDANSYRILVDTQNKANLLIGEKYDNEWKDYLSKMEDSQLNIIRKSKLFQSFLALSVLILSLTYLPYRFYNGYQKSQLELVA